MVFGIDDAIVGSVGGALVGGAAGLIGGNQTNAANMEMLREQQAFNSAEAVYQRNWQTEMSNSAYQRQVEDMRRAGINPMLAIMKSGGASTPGGAAASSPGGQRMESGLSKGLSSALDSLRMKNEIRALNADVANREQDTKLKEVQQLVAKATAEREANNALVARNNAKLSGYDLQVRERGMPGELKRTDAGNVKGEIDEKAAMFDAIIDRVGRVLGVGTSALGIGRGVKSLFGGKGMSSSEFEKQYDNMIDRSGSKGKETP